MAMKKDNQPEAPRFEDALGELESIVGRLEGGELGLEDALEQYEQGVRRLRQCYQLLDKAERRVELLSGVDEQGRPISQPFESSENDDQGESAADKPRPRRVRTKKPSDAKNRTKSSRENDIDEPPSLF
jgi:exodeoxyribonuclease VII small subunit